MSAWASPRPNWGSLQRSPRLPSWFQGATLRQDGNEGKETERLGEGEEGREGKGGMEKGGKRRKLGRGNSSLVVRG